MQNNERTLIVVFMYGESASRLTKAGFLNIDATISGAYLEKKLFDKVLWLTYDPDDVQLVAEMQERGEIAKGIEVIPAPTWARGGLGKMWYSLAAPFIHKKLFKQAVASIGQQTSGAWTGFIAKYFVGTRFVYRYGHSLWRRHWDRRQMTRLALSWPLDRILTRFSDHTLCCTHLDYDYNRGIKNVILCPNFIDTKTLPPQRPWKERQERGAFVGRLMPFKNVFNMVEACARANMPLDIYGDGPLREDLEAHAKKVGADVTFLGIRPNDEIRESLPNYKYHFLVSNYEGMPKALLEGMAAGALCIVSPIYGCTEIIDHEVNGIIAPGLDVDSLIEAIEQARASEGQTLGDNAVDKIQRQYSLDRVVDLHQKALFSNNQVA